MKNDGGPEAVRLRFPIRPRRILFTLRKDCGWLLQDIYDADYNCGWLLDLVEHIPRFGPLVPRARPRSWRVSFGESRKNLCHQIILMLVDLTWDIVGLFLISLINQLS